MDEIINALVNIGGIFLILATGYMIVTRLVFPQFALPWFGRKRRERAIDTANQLLALSDISDDERHRLERSRNTLLAYDARPRENWAGSLPAGDAFKEIERIREYHPD